MRPVAFAALLALLLSGCATTPEEPKPSPEVGVLRSPPLEGTPQKPAEPAGAFALPKPLAVDPTRLPIAPLELELVKPEVLELDNGLTVYLMTDRTAPIVNLRALVGAGTVDEPPEKLGVAHLAFALLPSGGAGKLGADELEELLAFHAADASGGSSDEHSTVDLSLRSEDLDKLFPVFADILLRPRFEKGRFEVTRGRFLESVRRRPDSPDGLAHRALRKAVYGPTSPLARESTAKTLAALTVSDVQAFHRRAVTPKNTFLLVSGDFERAGLIELVKRHLGAWSGPERLQHRYPEPPKLSRRVILVPKETAQVKIRIGGHGYRRLSPAEYAMRVAGTALGGSFTGRMYRQIRDERGLAYSAYAAVQPGPTTGLFFAAADTRPQAAAESIGAILELLERAKGDRPLTSGELAIAADSFLNSFVFRFDTPEKIVREKAVYDFFGYPEDYLDTYRDRIAQVDEKAAKEAVRQLVQLDQLQIVVVGPKDKLGDLSRFGSVVTVTDVETFR